MTNLELKYSIRVSIGVFVQPDFRELLGIATDAFVRNHIQDLVDAPTCEISQEVNGLRLVTLLVNMRSVDANQHPYDEFRDHLSEAGLYHDREEVFYQLARESTERNQQQQEGKSATWFSRLFSRSGKKTQHTSQATSALPGAIKAFINTPLSDFERKVFNGIKLHDLARAEGRADVVFTVCSDVGYMKLCRLAEEAYDWGEEHSHPSFEQYPQYEAIREVGSELDALGGIKLMRNVGERLKRHESRPALARFIEAMWHGIGQWRG